MTSASNTSQSERPGSGLADMSPAYFGLVMATGIISLAAHMMQYGALASGLFYLNLGQYGLLCFLYALRAWRYPARFFGDMVAHLTGPGYFTSVAGTGIRAIWRSLSRNKSPITASIWRP